VGYDIEFNTTWTPVGNPWVIRRSISIFDGVELVIKPGVMVQIDGPYSMECKGRGRIVAEGQWSARIEFIPTWPASFNYTYISTGIGGVFRNCTFSYGDACLDADNGAVIERCNFSESRTGILIKSNDVNISGCSFVKCELGIHLVNAFRSSISGCNMTYGIRGIYLEGTTADSSIERCNFIYSQIRGIEIRASGTGNRIMFCELTSTNYGIMVWYSRDVRIYSSTIVSCQGGISIFYSSISSTQSIVIERCRLIGNDRGLFLSGAQYTFITESTFQENQEGVREGLEGGTNVEFSLNNFLWNQKHIHIYNNTCNWSTGGIGNYWSDYRGVDLDDDGIGDSAYLIDSKGRDDFPLMKPMDFEGPVADAGPDVVVPQHSKFNLDGTSSKDDTWIANWTWTIEVPGGDIVLFGAEPEGRIDEFGNYTGTLRVLDAVGKVAFDDVRITVTDADPPRFVTLDLPPTVENGAVLNVSCRVNDNDVVATVLVEYSFGGGRLYRKDLDFFGGDLWVTGIQIPLDMDKDLFCSLRAKDRKGNVNSTEYQTVEVMDELSPRIVPDLPQSATTGENISINCTVSDNIGVSNVSIEWWFPEETRSMMNMSMVGGTWSSSIDIPPNASATISIIIHAMDTSGNSASTSVLVVQVLDNDAPTMTGYATSLSLDALHKGDVVTFTGTFVDNIGVSTSSLEYHYFSSHWESMDMGYTNGHYSISLPISTVEGNRLWFRFNVTDEAGNKLVTTLMEVSLLSQNPRILTTPISEAREDERYLLVLEAEDPDTETVELHWTLETNASWLRLNAMNKTLEGTPTDGDVGRYQVNCSVDDGEGGHAWLEFHLTVIDVNHPPTIEIRYPEDGMRFRSPFEVSGRATDDGNEIEWVQVQIDTEEWIMAAGTSQWSVEIDTKGMSPGIHRINVKAFDGSNESEVRTVDFRIPEPEEEHNPTSLIIVTVGIALMILAAALMLFSKRQRQ